MAQYFKSSVLRLALFFTCIIQWLIGAIILIITIFASLSKSNTPEVLGSYLFNGAVYTALFCAFFLIIVPAWGYVALERNSRLMLLLFIGGNAILLLLAFCTGISLLVFPTPLQTSVMAMMNKTLVTEYGKRGVITDSWNFIQSYLRCCAAADNGWLAYRGSWWDLSVNSYIFNPDSQLPESSLFYKRVPVSCCVTLIDPFTGRPSGYYRNVEQCQNWEYGPPRFIDGPHNDAIYYTGCFSSIKSYLDRFSKPVGALILITSFILILVIVCSVFLLRHIETKSKYAIHY